MNEASYMNWDFEKGDNTWCMWENDNMGIKAN